MKKPDFSNLSSRDKQALYFVLRYHLIGFKYEFTINRFGQILFQSPGTTSARYFSAYDKYGGLSVAEKYLGQLAFFAVIRLLRNGHIASLVASVPVAAGTVSKKAALLNVWDVILGATGCTLAELTAGYAKNK